MPTDLATQTGGLAPTLLVLLACTAFGSMLGGAQRPLRAADTMVGIGLAGMALTILSVCTRVSVSLWATVLGILAVAALAVAARRRTMPGGVGFLLVLLLFLPLLLIAAESPATNWDDFWHWLPNAAYVHRYDSLPRHDLPSSFSQWPGYPATMPFLVAASSWATGRFLESAGPITNVVLLASFAAVLADAIHVFRPANSSEHSVATGLARVGGAAAICGAFYLGLGYDVLYSTYADMGTMVAVGILGLLGILLMEYLAQARVGEARIMAWRFGFAAAALVNLKQANPVLLALLLVGLTLVAWRDSRIPVAAAIRLLPALLGPALLVLIVWRAYVVLNIGGGEMSFRPLAQCNFGESGSMLKAIVEWHFWKMPAFFVAMWLIAFAGSCLLFWLPSSAGDRLLIITAVLWLGYNVFMVTVYLGAMSASEASWAADYYRYMPHIGLLAVAATVVRLDALEWPKWSARTMRAMGLACVIAVPSFFSARAEALTPLTRTWPMYVRKVGADVADMLPPGAQCVIFAGYNQDVMAVSLQYDVLRRGRDARGLGALIFWDGDPVDPIAAAFREGRTTHLVVTDKFGPPGRVADALALPALHNETALLQWTGTGWRKQASWPLPQSDPRD